MSKLVMKTVDIGGQPHDYITGKLVSFKVNLNVQMQRILNRQSPDAPHWEVFAKAPHGETVKVGLAKEHEIKKGEHREKVMLSIYFTDPEFEGVSFSAFPTNEHNCWEAQTERKRKPQVAAAAPVDNAPVNDEIPY